MAGPANDRLPDVDAARRAVTEFRRTYGDEPTALIRSPGRVNLIGEHTDYNDGLVLPMAIEPALWLAVGPNEGRLTVVSADADGVVDVPFAAFDARQDGWGIYAQAVVWAADAAGLAVHGARAAAASDIPVGAGLSSSAALELAVLRALLDDAQWDPPAVARVAQRAENGWVGVESGIMDQLSSAAGRPGHALLIDCRTLEIDHVPLPAGVAVVIMDTGTRRELAGSEYNVRRRQCADAAAALGVTSLRDADSDAVERLDDLVLRRRARHIVTENARTVATAAAMRAEDIAALGALLEAGHRSLRDDFEVSTSELDTMVACAADAPGYLGARMTGAGFGGCAVALVTAQAASAFTETVTGNYRTVTGLAPRLYVTGAAGGTEVVPLGAVDRS